MTASPENVQIDMRDMSGGGSAERIRGIPIARGDWVQKEQWPSFEEWEYAVVFKEDMTGVEIKHFRTFLKHVEDTGLVGQLFRSPSNDRQLTLKLRATPAWYDAMATKLNYLYELKPIQCEVPEEAAAIVQQKLDREGLQAPVIEKMYEPFDADEKGLYMFNGYHNMYTSFRVAMIEYILRERSVEGGCDLFMYVNKFKIVANYFPLHERERVTWFQSNWVLSMPWNSAPIDEIRNYFGEKIAFYFAWLSHFTNWLVAPGIIGACLALFLVTRKVEEVNRSIIGPVFGIFLMVYMTVYLEFWKRRSATLAFRWGVTDYNKKEPDRPEYLATIPDYNFFTQELTMTYPKRKRLAKQLVGIPAVLFTIAVACTVIVIILMWKYVQFLLGPDKQKDPFAPWKIAVPSIVNAICIIIFSNVHRKLAIALNNWENYQTQSEYESQLISKVFFFEFVNNFTGLLYTAFGRNDMYQLYFAILIQMVVMQLVGNIQALVMPQIDLFLRRRKQNQGMRFSWADVLAGNDPYDTFGDFNEIVIQFGYVMFFSAAFPAAAALSWFNNIIEIRLDAHSILNCEPRPAAERSGGIGVWFQIIEVMSFIAIVVNALVFCMTSNAIGSGIHNLCQFAFSDIDVTTNPQNLMMSLSWYQQGCVSFCSGMYLSQTFHNPDIRLGPCGTIPVIDSKTNVSLPSCKNIPSPVAVYCTEQSPCPGPQSPEGLVDVISNNCDTPFLCNPVPLRVPIGSPRSLIGRQSNSDWSRAYCQESPKVNLGSGEWRYKTPTQIFAWNPFMNNFAASGKLEDFPAYQTAVALEYGMMSCSLFCDPKKVPSCPYSKTNPTFNPKVARSDSFKPMDYIDPDQLQKIQASRSVKCVFDEITGYQPPSDSIYGYCFLCPDVDLALTVPVTKVDYYNEVVFTTMFGPSVAAVWTVLVFEHIVLIIKFIVMAMIPDVTDDIENQLVGHDTYRRRLAMSRLGRNEDQKVLGQRVSKLVEAVGEDTKDATETIRKLPEDDQLWDHPELTLAMFKANMVTKHEVQFKKSRQVLNVGPVNEV